MRHLLRDSLPEAIGALIAAAVIVIFSTLGRRLLKDIEILIIVIAFVIWISCLYIYKARSKPRVHSIKSSSLKRKGPYRFSKYRPIAKFGIFSIPVLTIIGILIRISLLTPRSNNVLVLISEFNGPDPARYQVTTTIYDALEQLNEGNNFIQVERLDEEVENRSFAISIGQEKDADIVIWGWYADPGDVTPVSVNFEILGELENVISLCPSAQGEIRLLPADTLSGFTMQLDLAQELSYLTMFTSGMAYYIRGDWRDAVNTFELAIELAPENDSSWPISNTYFYSARASMELGEFPTAIDQFSISIDFNKSLTNAYINRALSFVELGDYESAILDYSYVQILAPNNTLAWKLRGDIYFWQGRYSEAIEDYEFVLERIPTNPCVILDTAYAYLEAEDYENANVLFTQLINSGTTKPEATFGIGRIHFHQGNLDESVQKLTESILMAKSVGYRFPAALLYRGYAYISSGEESKAIKYFREIVRSECDANTPCVEYPVRGYEENLMTIATDLLQDLDTLP